MMKSRLISTAMLGALIGAIGYAPAQAEELDADEVNYASHGVLCVQRARKVGDQQSLAFWTEFKADIEPKYWAKASANLDAVKGMLDDIDPALLEQRCSEYQAVLSDPNYYEEPLSDDLVALSEKVKAEIGRLSNSMHAAGFAADDLNIPLRLSVQFSNRVDDRLTVAREVDGLFSKMTQALDAQRKGLTREHREDVLDMSAKTLYLCRWAAQYDSYNAVQSGEYSRASYALTQSVLWAALSNKREIWGGASYVPRAEEAVAVQAVDNLSEWKALSSVDQVLLIGMDTACDQKMDNDFMSAYITPALSVAYPSVSTSGGAL